MTDLGLMTDLKMLVNTTSGDVLMTDLKMLVNTTSGDVLMTDRKMLVNTTFGDVLSYRKIRSTEALGALAFVH
jgi:hypothetical protein